MKMDKYIFLVSAVIMAIACTKEIAPESDQNPAIDLVPLTFTTVADTEEETVDTNSKVFYDGTTKTTQWSVGDLVKIVNISGNAYDFSVTEVSEDGKSATIKGEAEKSEVENGGFYAVYPATAYKGNDLAAPTNPTKGGRLYIDVPAVQTAVAGTFDPKAFVCVASSSGSILTFKNLCSVIRFSLNEATDVKSVRFTMTGNTNLASCANVYVSNISSHTWGDAFEGRTSSNMITLKAPAGGFKADTDYYFTLRPFTQSGDTKGFSFYVEYSDHYKVRKNETLNLVAKRNGIKGLGALDVEGKIAPLPFYDAYNLGFDLNVAGKVINKKTYGDATLITETKGLDKYGVYFVDSDATANFNSGIAGNLIVIGNTPGVRSNVKRTDVSYLTASEGADALIMHNVKYVDCTANVFQLNAATAFETILFDNCLFNVATGKSLILSNSAVNTITDLTITNCDVRVDGAVNFVKMGGSTINSIAFENNVIYADTEMTSFLAVNSTAKVESVVFNNNTLYNTTIGTATANEDAIVKANNIADFMAKNNYIVYANSTTNRYLGRATFAGGDINNNVYVRKSDTTTPIYGVPGTKPTWVTQPEVKAVPSNLIINWDPANDKYIIGGFAGVGAIR